MYVSFPQCEQPSIEHYVLLPISTNTNYCASTRLMTTHITYHVTSSGITLGSEDCKTTLPSSRSCLNWIYTFVYQPCCLVVMIQCCDFHSLWSLLIRLTLVIKYLIEFNLSSLAFVSFNFDRKSLDCSGCSVFFLSLSSGSLSRLKRRA